MKKYILIFSIFMSLAEAAFAVPAMRDPGWIGIPAMRDPGWIGRAVL